MKYTNFNKYIGEFNLSMVHLLTARLSHCTPPSAVVHALPCTAACSHLFTGSYTAASTSAPKVLSFFPLRRRVCSRAFLFFRKKIM